MPCSIRNTWRLITSTRRSSPVLRKTKRSTTSNSFPTGYPRFMTGAPKLAFVRMEMVYQSCAVLKNFVAVTASASTTRFTKCTTKWSKGFWRITAKMRKSTPKSLCNTSSRNRGSVPDRTLVSHLGIWLSSNLIWARTNFDS
jgi:hypothetical protein